MLNNNKQKIDNLFKAFSGRINASIAELPLIVGNLVVNDSLDNFRNQSFDGVPWPKRKSKGKRGAGNQNTLIQSGRLRRGTRITGTTARSVKVGNDVPYAEVHNEGLEIKRKSRTETFVRNRYTKGKKKGKFKKGTTAGNGFTFKSSSFKMPKRQFLGRSKSLDIKINKTVKQHIYNALKK